MAVRQNPGAPDRCERQVAGEESPNHGQRSQTQLSVWPMSRLLGGMAYNLQMPACSAEATASPWRYAGDRANRAPPALPLLCPIRLADVMSIADSLSVSSCHDLRAIASALRLCPQLYRSKGAFTGITGCEHLSDQ